jgi:hypothetical protein
MTARRCLVLACASRSPLRHLHPHPRQGDASGTGEQTLLFSTGGNEKAFAGTRLKSQGRIPSVLRDFAPVVACSIRLVSSSTRHAGR